jgi:thiol-disulfide isomerase/thioredoxin
MSPTLACALLLFCSVGFVQQISPAQQDPSADEERQLSQALSEAGSSPIELVRALEGHLAKFPDSPRKAEYERVLVKAAIENKDDKRIILYGERVLAREQDDIQILDRVARALLSGDSKETSERALKYSRRYEQLIAQMRKEPPQGRMGQGQWRDELDRGLARALALQARASGNLARIADATALARRAYEAFPTAEAAREIGRWLLRAGKEEEAIQYLADAFSIVDLKNNETERARDRQLLGEIYRKLKGSEKGLGDLILEAYDRTTLTLNDRKTRLSQSDPNSQASQVLDFTLSGTKGEKLQLASLKGKAIVFDFWATWCVPCRVQQPLYEKVKKKFRFNPEVIFLSINTDDDRSLVEPFLQEQKWTQTVYFEDGLARNLQITSIPTTIVLNRAAEIVSRMNGFVPDRFVEMLSQRIEEALK